ncbi:response regulator transcription factor [Alkalibacterium pelagium]|uniref:DNA-binding response regulator, OmpR family, contains REC and winged-helix (WHTH) domain n=1 Tax=Alkalibacterium pelagium TaxID=426702 RepID=A0A1H7MA56_9LACT|nr:response regulator transcription factor [Alkalibacterium pelagium]GEN51123.1 DNA-binding response regulator [Alkalibacterium pelagium]SEL08210.1 DNA-binding response regulator, OmpR family, contains REC and winged-helix (wHTH) domain [Alkalibacterium pelagium]
MNILVVDDEQSILDIIHAYLTAQGHTVYLATNGKQALQLFNDNSVDFIVLDIMLPDVSGWEICENIRRTSSVPIILLTARSNEKDVLKGLQLGADDYIKKPFSPKELLARIATVNRRVSRDDEIKQEKWVFNKGNLIIYPDRMEVNAYGSKIVLTHTEFDLLLIMASNPKHVFSREQLLEKVKGLEATALDRVIDSHIKNLRAKIEENPRKPLYIETVHGAGYRFGVTHEKNTV